jgi:hypothetical protein
MAKALSMDFAQTLIFFATGLVLAAALVGMLFIFRRGDDA